MCVHRWSSAKKTSKITGKIAINGWREETTPKEGLSVYECVCIWSCAKYNNNPTVKNSHSKEKKVRQNKGKKPNKKSRSLSYKTPNTEIRSQKKYQKVINSQTENANAKIRWSYAIHCGRSRVPRESTFQLVDPNQLRQTGSSPCHDICWISRVAENESAGGGTLNGLSPRSTLIYKQIWPGYECPGGLPRGSVIGWYRISTTGRFQLSHNEFSKSAPHPKHRTLNATNLRLA